MQIYTFDEDLFGLENFARRLEEFIATEIEFVEGSLVIALTSKYGSGKTTFLNMWKSSLESDGEDTDRPLVISLNAWESDYYGDPLFAIISGMVACMQQKGRSPETLVNAAKDVGWFATAIGSQIVNKITGIDTIAAGEIAEKKKAIRDEPIKHGTDTFSMYEGRKNAMKSLKDAVGEFVFTSNSKILFFVDELDRCRPDYAITYLETIKHIFDVKGAVFIITADRQQLENSAKTAFGADLDFEEYYRKFVHREVKLPPISESGYRRIASKYVDYYLEREGSRFCFMEIDRHGKDEITELVGGLKLTPRQIQEVFRILGHIFETTEENRGRLKWCIAVGSVVMAVLKVGQPDIFHLLGTQQLEPKNAVEFLEHILQRDHKVNWWFMLFLTGGGILTSESESKEEVMKRAGLIEGDANVDLQRDFSQWRSGWGHSDSSRFKQIHEKIEQISQWS